MNRGYLFGRSSSTFFSSSLRLKKSAVILRDGVSRRRVNSRSSAAASFFSSSASSSAPQQLEHTKDDVAAMSPSEWTSAFTTAVSEIRSDLGFEESSQQLRSLIKTGESVFVLTRYRRRGASPISLSPVFHPLSFPMIWGLYRHSRFVPFTF